MTAAEAPPPDKPEAPADEPEADAGALAPPDRAEEPNASPPARPPLELGVAGTRALAAAVAALFLFTVLAKSGIWDPFELDGADLARRIAIQVFGAKGLELPKATSSLPTLTDLRMGELPFTSMAIALRLFGLHDWAGRLALAVWSFAGAASLYAVVERLVHRRAALYAVAALVSMPLFFMQARTMLGDAVTIAALTMAFSGLAGAAFDDASAARRVAWGALAIAGLAAGFMTRGALLGVAVPALGVGAAWAILRSSGVVSSGVGTIVGVAALALGAGALFVFFRVFLGATADMPLQRVVGFAIVKRAPIEGTFDLPLRQLGHALFPWSAFLPVAIGRVFAAPPGASEGSSAVRREAALRVALLTTAAVAFAAYSFIAPSAGNLAFSGPALLAAVAAIAIFDFERGAPASRAAGMITTLLGAVLLVDLLNEPARALACFVVDKPQAPKSFEVAGARILKIAGLAFVGLVGLVWFDDEPGPRPRRDATAYLRDLQETYRAASEELSFIWQGNLAFSLVVVEAALVGLGAMIAIGRSIAWAPVLRLPKNFADLGLVTWLIAPALLGLAPAVLIGARDGFRAIVEITRTRRAAWTIVAGLVSGGALAFVYFPAIAAQLSPKEVFEAYAVLAKPGEPLALLNVRARAASYYAHTDVDSVPDPTKAFDWLKTPGPRRWLVLKADDLPKVNAIYRRENAKNLPILDAASSQILLASSALGDASNQSPLMNIVLDAAPKPQHHVDAEFEDQLDAIGWDVLERGKRVDSVVPGTAYKLRVYYRSLRPITQTWKAFVHIDGQQKRYNGDHAVCDGKYPMVLWQPGDIVADELEFQLEPNFTPGDYTVYFGFFLGETRFRVTRGAEQENRVVAGTIRVR